MFIKLSTYLKYNYHIIHRMLFFTIMSIIATAYTLQTSSKPNVLIRGSTAPLIDFDPFGFSKGKDIAYLREAELKHSRWAMVGSVSIPLIEHVTHRPAIFEFSGLSESTQICITALIAAYEFQFMLNGWKNPYTNSFELHDNYQPGDAGFKLYDLTNKNIGILMDKELNNGRLAMIAFVGIMAQELVTLRPII